MALGLQRAVVILACVLASMWPIASAKRITEALPSGNVTSRTPVAGSLAAQAASHTHAGGAATLRADCAAPLVNAAVGAQTSTSTSIPTFQERLQTNRQVASGDKRSKWKLPLITFSIGVLIVFMISAVLCASDFTAPSKPGSPCILSPSEALRRRCKLSTLVFAIVGSGLTSYMYNLCCTGQEANNIDSEGFDPDIAFVISLVGTVLLTVAPLALLCYLPPVDPNEKDIDALQDSSQRGRECHSEVFAFTLPPDLAKKGVDRMWGCCGIWRQAAHHQFPFRELLWGCVFAGGVFFSGKYAKQTTAFQKTASDGGVGPAAVVFVVSVLLVGSTRVYIIVASTIRLFLYRRRAAEDVTVLLHFGYEGVRAWFFEFIAPTPWERYWDDDAFCQCSATLTTEYDAMGPSFVLQLVKELEDCSNSVDWPCCLKCNDKSLCFEVPVPEDIVPDLRKWLELQGIQNAKEVASGIGAS